MKSLQTLSQPSTLTSLQDDRKGNNAFSSGILSLADKTRSFEGKPKLRGQIGQQLTDRETTVLQLIAKGKCNKEAATELCVSIKTVEKHREHLMEKLGIRGTALLTHFAIAAGIIQCNPWPGNAVAQNQELHLAGR